MFNFNIYVHNIKVQLFWGKNKVKSQIGDMTVTVIYMDMYYFTVGNDANGSKLQLGSDGITFKCTVTF